MGTPTFMGKHNQRKAQAMFVFYRYSLNTPGGQGLTAGDLRELLGLGPTNACELLYRMRSSNYIGMDLTPARTSRVRIYRINSKGLQWMIKCLPIIPWKRYGWTAETMAEIDRKIKEIVQFRGYN